MRVYAITQRFVFASAKRVCYRNYEDVGALIRSSKKRKKKTAMIGKKLTIMEQHIKTDLNCECAYLCIVRDTNLIPRILQL